ncbi:MAG: hypothetical protein QGM46_11310 [Actinomycetota bacterium]|nr:hypothetical protein [Actinomycetota bacterium]
MLRQEVAAWPAGASAADIAFNEAVERGKATMRRLRFAELAEAKEWSRR